MTDAFLLVLDTTPPRVEFGDVGGATAGQFLQVAYTSDEPLGRATLIDAGGQRIDLTIDATTLSVALPPSTYDGWATIEWADDVGNADSLVAAVLIVGAVVPPPQTEPPKPGGMPRPDKRPMVRRRLTARTPITVKTRSARVESSRTTRRRTGITIVTSVQTRTRQSGEVRIALSARSSRRAATHWASPAVQVKSTASIRRRDDPTIEAFLLDLL